MRHLVVCCDGTWNTPEQQRGGVLAPTNVVRPYHSLHENDTQLRYYHSGVGTDRGLLNRLLGGGLGNGLLKNIKSAYYWNICPGPVGRNRPLVRQSIPPDPNTALSGLPHPRVQIRFLGVWDTVGSLGIPHSLGLLSLSTLPATLTMSSTTAAPVLPAPAPDSAGRSADRQAALCRRRAFLGVRPERPAADHSRRLSAQPRAQEE